MGGFLLWRLRSSVSLPSALAPACAGVVLVAIVAAVALAWRARRRRLGWDGGALSLVLAGLPASSAPPRAARAAVWPGRPTRVGRRVRLAASADAREPGECEAIGIVGTHASQCALWCAGQIAAQLGGARVWWKSAAPVLIGHAGVDIHVSDRDSCPHCTRDATRPTLHIGYASSLSLLPAWCAQVCVTDDEPVSSHWWWTVTRADAQDSLPTRLDWDPSSARGRGGGLSVRIGLGEEGPVDLDLVADGPHALVAGCTGSGKSEALLGWLAAIAHCYSPEQVRFILIDYKGGATFARLEALPHTQALLTDLDAGATTRALEGIASILQRREEALGALGFPDLAAWESAHEEDPVSVSAPPPRLVVAIDEFRVLAQAHPDSMEVLLRLAAQGRSLGLHLIAATQRPSGAVSAQMRANMDIRLCLRCVSASDSTDILGDGRAASRPRVPGRAVLSDVGTIQLTYLADIASVVERCNTTWP
ncbi:MAG: cell division protein FtsK, partial [Thermobifida sp.]|nr:cell division protein FtsK [Thermobifida sp.]